MLHSYNMYTHMRDRTIDHVACTLIPSVHTVLGAYEE